MGHDLGLTRSRGPKVQASRHESLRAQRSRLRTEASPKPNWSGPPSSHGKPTGLLWLACFHVAPRSALWETESPASRAPRLALLKKLHFPQRIGLLLPRPIGTCSLWACAVFLAATPRKWLRSTAKSQEVRGIGGRQDCDCRSTRGLKASAAFPRPHRPLLEVMRRAAPQAGSASKCAAGGRGAVR